MPIAPVLQRFVDEELALAPALVDRLIADTLQALRESRLPAPPGLASALQAGGAACRRAFLDTLIAGVRSQLAELDASAPGASVTASGSLELMDESQVEVDIEISRAMQQIDSAAEWELRELQTYTSTLVGQVHVSAESNPFRPQVYATALWAGASAVVAPHASRAALLRASAEVASGLLRKAWAAACTRLEQQGVEPGIYRTVLLAPGTAPTRGASAPAGSLAALLSSMPGDASGPVPVGVGVGVGRSAPAPSAPALPPAFEQALARLEEVLHRLAPDGTSVRAQADTLGPRLALHRNAITASAATSYARQVVGLVGRLFDSMLADPQIPPGFATVIARLEASALRVALADSTMLASPQHAVWRFIDDVGTAGGGHPQATDARGAALLGHVHGLVERLARKAAPQAVDWERARSQLDGFLADQLRDQLGTAQASVHALRRAERRELLVQQLTARLADQVVPYRLTSGMRRFVTGTWSQVLAEAMLREGEQAPATRGYIKLVDELLWSLRLPDHPQSRQRLVALLPGMLQRLRTGLASIHLPAPEQEQVLNELMEIHARALRPGSPDEAAATPAEIVQRLRDEVLPPSTGHGGFSDSVIDIGTLETVPAELLSEDHPAQPVQALQPGDRLRIFLHGRWSRMQVLWRSDQGLYVLLAGETAGATHSVSQRALDKLSAAGLVQPLESRTLVQRALDNVTRALVQA